MKRFFAVLFGLAIASLCVAIPAQAGQCEYASIGTAASPGALRSNAVGSCTTADVRGFWPGNNYGGGRFYWDATSVDTDDGGTVIAVQTPTDPTCVSCPTSPVGRWKRVRESDAKFNPTWFGARGPSRTDAQASDPAGLDDGAFAVMMAAIEAMPGASPGAVVYAPRGTYLFANTLTIRRTIRLVGDGGDNHGYATRFRWTTLNIDGILVRARSGTTPPADPYRADFTRIQDILIQGPFHTVLKTWTANEMDQWPPPVTGSGIVIKANGVTVDSVYIIGWGADGVDCVAFANNENANDCVVRMSSFSAVNRNGVYFAGENSSAGHTYSNRFTGVLNGYSIYDRSFLGDAHAFNHSEGASHSYYSAGGVNAASWHGNYNEASDGPPSYHSYATVVGGKISGGITNNSGASASILATLTGGRGLMGGIVKTPVAEPLRFIVRPTTDPVTGSPIGPTSFYNIPIQMGIDGIVSVDTTNGYAVTTIPAASSANGLSITFKNKATGSPYYYQIGVGGCVTGCIEGSGNYHVTSGKSVKVVSDGTTWQVISGF
jgi:hypothetical protein